MKSDATMTDPIKDIELSAFGTDLSRIQHTLPDAHAPD
jgi:hypothetical protein